MATHSSILGQRLMGYTVIGSQRVRHKSTSETVLPLNSYGELPIFIFLYLKKIFFYLYIALFMFDRTASCFTGLFLPCGEWGLLSSCVPWASHCGDFCCCRARALGHVTGLSSCILLTLGCSALVVEEHCSWVSGGRAPAHTDLNSHDSRASLVLDIWNLPRAGMDPCPLHWQMDSSSLCFQGGPHVIS